MIYLIGNTAKLQLVTSSTAPVDVVVAGVEADTSGLTTQTAVGGPVAIVTATTTDILALPSSGTKTRTLKQMTARNKSATLSTDVTLLLNVSATLYEIHKVTLGPGETLIYTEGLGFYTLKPAAGLDKLLFVTADVVNSTVTMADITGLTVPLLSGKRYAFDATLFHLSAAATTGANFGVNIGAAPTNLILGNWSGVTNSVTAGVGSLGVVTARDTPITAQTGSSATNTMTNIEGMIQPSADGTFALRFSSEVAASAVTVRLGSWLKIRQE